MDNAKENGFGSELKSIGNSGGNFLSSGRMASTTY